jgi:putative pyruvate formate lyase activating enzyme
MHRQVGDLVVGGDGVAMGGVLIRHLVLPGDLADTREIMRFISRGISADSYVNIMPQYRPCGHANRFPPIDQQLGTNDYEKAMEVARSEGLKRLDPPVRKFVVW